MDTTQNRKALRVIFGTGPLGRFTAEALLDMGYRVRLASRSGKMESPPAGAQVVAADARVPGQARDSVAGAGVKLVAAENLYPCGNTAGASMVETMPFRPCSRKGEVIASP